MVDVGPQFLDAGQGITDGLGELGLAGDFGQLVAEPVFQIVEQRFGFILPDGSAAFWRLASHLFLDAIKRGDPFDCFFGDHRALRLEHIDELAPDVRHARDLADTA